MSFLTEHIFTNITPYFPFTIDQIRLIHKYNQLEVEYMEARKLKEKLEAQWEELIYQGIAYIDSPEGKIVNPEFNKLYVKMKYAIINATDYFPKLWEEFTKSDNPYFNLCSNLQSYFSKPDYTPTQHLNYLNNCIELDCILTMISNLYKNLDLAEREKKDLMKEMSEISHLIMGGEPYGWGINTYYQVLENLEAINIKIERIRKNIDEAKDEAINYRIQINKHIRFLATNTIIPELAHEASMMDDPASLDCYSSMSAAVI